MFTLPHTAHPDPEVPDEACQCAGRARRAGETLSQRYDEHNDTFRSYHPFFSALVGLVGLVAMPFLRQAHFPQWGMAGKRSDHRIRWGTTIPFLMRYGKVPSPVVKVVMRMSIGHS